MTMPATLKRRAKLQAAADYVADRLRAGDHALRIIEGLVAGHGATHVTGRDPNALQCAGVSATCTWSKDEGLLENWRKNATLRLAEAGRNG